MESEVGHTVLSKVVVHGTEPKRGFFLRLLIWV
jgi:hypothetical protein